tara:strand:+ start:7728 stop:8150 length:423 start_codon:yes stop_codon:yes gene_type:complete
MKYKQKKIDKLSMRHSYLKSMVEKSTPKKKEEGKTIIGSNGKVVGVVMKDTLHKRVNSSKHFLRKPPAIAFDKDCIEKAKKLGAIKIMVHDLDTKKRFMANYKEFERHAIKLNRGFGEQLALPISMWNILDPNQLALSLS